MKPKVLHLITGLKPGGAEKVVFDLCRMANQFEPYVISLSKRNELLERFREENIPTEVLNMSKNPIDLIRVVRKVVSFTKSNDIKVIHAHMTHALIIACIVKLFHAKLKIIFTSHTANVGSRLREIILWLFIPLRFKDIVFSDNVTFYTKRGFLTIPNGINTVEYNLDLVKNKKFTLITIGRIEDVKNHSALLDIIHEIKDDFDFELHIVGDGILREDIEQKINNLGLNDKVKLLGFRKDIAQLCNKSHVFILTSKWEGLPISLLEAGASGIPIISTPVGSIPSLVTKDFGYLSELKMFPNVIRYVYNNYNDAMSKAEKLKKEIKRKYDLQTIIQKHEELYLNAIQ